MDNIVFNGADSRDFGVKINRVNAFAAPMPRVTEYIVPGRNGAVVVDDGTYDNVDLDYTLACYNAVRGDIQVADAIRDWLLQDGRYHRLEDSRWPDEYRLARISALEITQIGSVRRSIEAAVTFSCRPERWLKSGEQPITMDLAGLGQPSAVVLNPTGRTAHPRILVPPSQSTITVRVRQSTWYGYAEYSISSHDGDIEIDTFTGNSVFASGQLAGNPANAWVTFFPNGPNDFELRAGTSTISATITTPEAKNILIYPRWWMV